MTAISGAAYTCRMLVDGTLAITVHIEPQEAQQAFAMFGRPGAPLALAPLVVGHAAVTEPEKPKGGERAKWVAMRCNEIAFQDWLFEHFAEHANLVDQSMTAPHQAASIVRTVCGVKSRAELDTDKYAPYRFDVLIRKAWAAHNGVAA